MLTTRPLFNSFEEKLRYGEEVINQYLPFFEDASQINEHFKQVLEDRILAAQAGIIFENAVLEIASTVKKDPQEVAQMLVEGKSVLEEATTSTDVSGADINYLGIVSFFYPALVGAKVVGFQAMEAPTGKLFLKKYYAETPKGSVQPGAELQKSDTSATDLFSQRYASDIVSNELVATADGTATTFSKTLDYKPVIPSTVTVVAGTLVATDDGNGNISGDFTGTINYDTGAVQLTFAAAPANGTQIKATYRYNQENNKYGKLKMKLEAKDVSVQSHKLGFTWTVESAQDLLAYHKIAIEDDVSNTLINAVASEIDARIITDLYALANAGAAQATWNSTPPANADPTLYKTTIVDKVRLVLTSILDRLGGRFPGGFAFVVAGSTAWAHLTQSGRFERKQANLINGVQQGTLDGDIQAYYSPFLPANAIVVGVKGNDNMSSGYFYAPYTLEISKPVPVINAAGEIDPFVWQKGVLSRDAFVNVNPFYYGLVNVV